MSRKMPDFVRRLSYFLKSGLLWKIFFPERDIFHSEFFAFQVVQRTGIRGKIKAQFIGVQGLPGLVIAAVHVPLAVLAVPQQGAADLRHRDADLVGAACQQAAFHQGEAVPAFQGLIKGDGSLAAGHRLMEETDLFFCFVLQQKALNFPLRPLGTAHSDAEIGLFQLVGPDLLVDDPQGLGVFGSDDDAAGVAVDIPRR